MNLTCRLLVLPSAFALMLALAPTTEAAMVGGYLLDGEAGAATPDPAPEQGGNTGLDLKFGSCATYSADTPFSYSGNTSLDTACGPNARVWDGLPRTITDYNFQNTDEFTIKAWVKFEEDGGFRQVVSNRQNNTGNGWYLGITSGEQAFMFVQGMTAGQGRGAQGTTVLNDGEWHSLVGIHNPNFDSDGAIQIYVDGVLEDTSSKSQTEAIDYASFEPVVAIGLGFDGGGGYNDFDGLIDEVGIFDHAFTEAEAIEAFERSMIPEPASLALLGLGGLLMGRRRR